jgi:arginase
MQIALIGVPSNSSGTNDGVALAPQALREAGLVTALRKHVDVIDFGDVEFLAPNSERNSTSGIIADKSLASMLDSVRCATEKALAANYFPLLLGGDCPLLIGSFASAQNLFGNIGLIFLDGHEDAYPPKQSPSGEAADMELGMLLGRGKDDLPDYLQNLVPSLKPSEVILLGARDATILRDENVQSLAGQVEMYDDATIQGKDAAELMDSVVKKLSKQNSALWLHLDLDILSTSALPAVDYQQPGGIDWNQLELLTTTSLKSGKIIGWNVTIYNPDMDPERSSAKRIVQFIESSIAQSLSA